MQNRRAVEPKIKTMQQRTLVIVSDNDLLLPSKEEGPRLQKLLPRANLKVGGSSVRRPGPASVVVLLL